MSKENSLVNVMNNIEKKLETFKSPNVEETQKRRYKPNKYVSGILFMLLHALAITGLYAISKHMRHYLPEYQLAFVYKFVIFLGILPWCLSGDIKKTLMPKSVQILCLHAARGAFSILGTIFFFKAIIKVPITDAAAMTYLEQGIMVLVGFLYFRESFTRAKLVMVILSFLGAMLIVRPGFGGFEQQYQYYGYILIALIFWAFNNTVIKMLGRTERTKAQLFYVTLFSCLFSFPLAFSEWRAIQVWQIKYLLGIAICYLIHAVAFFKAFKFADISTVMPFEYSRLIFTALFGYFIFKETPDNFAIIGYSMIIFGGLYALQYEARKQRNKQEPPILEEV
jgi:S-adenosylmethionine uptake transporter